MTRGPSMGNEESGTPGQKSSGARRRKSFGDLIDEKRLSAYLKPYESPRELSSRLQEEAAEARHRRIKDLVLFLFLLILLGASSFSCLALVARNDSSPEDKKWATGVLAAIVSGGIGFLTGKAQKS